MSLDILTKSNDIEIDETMKITFEKTCLMLVSLLEEEYEYAQKSDYIKLHEINLQKAQYQEQFQNFLFNFVAESKEIPADMVPHVEAVHKLSQRNSSYLAGAIEGVSSIIRELKRSAETQNFTGLYNPDGSFKPSEESQTNIGKV